MNKWKNIIPLMLCSSLMACNSTRPLSSEQSEMASQPNVEIEPKIATEPKIETDPALEAEAEIKQEKKAVSSVEEPKLPVVNEKKTADGKLILGEEEWVYFPGLKESFKARIDTGATTSSISATDIVQFERDGRDWVKFKISHGDLKSAEINLPVERWVKIRQSSSEEGDKRAIVVAWIEIGNLKDRTEFTLADRSHLSYPVLIGRSLFRDMAVVDVSKKFVQPKRKK